MTTLLEPLQPVAVLGSGGWGTALAVHLGRLGKPVWLWGRNQTLVTQMVAHQENRLYLPGVELPELVRPTHLLVKRPHLRTMLMRSHARESLHTQDPQQQNQSSPETLAGCWAFGQSICGNDVLVQNHLNLKHIGSKRKDWNFTDLWSFIT